MIRLPERRRRWYDYDSFVWVLVVAAAWLIVLGFLSWRTG